jgi:hypothetical protein
MKKLIDKTSIWKSELERQNVSHEIQSLFSSMNEYLHEQQKEIDRLRSLAPIHEDMKITHPRKNDPLNDMSENKHELYDKEDLYDEKIFPLMKQIIDICKQEKLPMTAQFYLKEKWDDGEPMYSSSVVLPAKMDMLDEAYDQMRFISDGMKYGANGSSFAIATTIRVIS